MRFQVSKKEKRLALTLPIFFFLLSPVYGREEQTKPEGKTQEGRKVQKVNVVAERFNFTPSQIKVKEGALLEITLTSDDTFHGFRVPSANINQIIPARGRGSVKVIFDAKEKGTYPFECSRPCGAGHTMMRGVIIVE
jgi:cytochrome c oxidase subunit II